MATKKINIAINGFGRIGRLTFRELIKSNNINVVGINDLTDTKTLAHLLKYDSAQGVLDKKVSYTDKEIIVGSKKIPVFSEKDPTKLPWGKLGVDLVIESTGRFTDEKSAGMHLQAGAKKVLISAPATGNIPTIVFNVNHKILTKDDKIVSGASCTTNALAPMAKVLDEKFGIEWGLMNTIHAYTADQRLQDAPHSDLRRARAASTSMIPTSTGAAKAIGLVLPTLKGKLHGLATRVPTITGSLVDLTVVLKKDASLTSVNKAMKAAANESFGYEEAPIVSCDVIGDTHGSIFDPGMTLELDVDNGKAFKVFTWYDNEYSYVSQLVRTAKYLAKL
ncbi:MAG: type I glyceraldehyde-3-phosphate dehydrogenase [Mycoplasmoidaceae bacterium]